MDVPTELERLWRMVGGDFSDANDDWNGKFDPIGLILLAPPRHMGYWCTPSNSVTFATTGGDGVHYGWLQDKENDPNNSPIVMTVPMADQPNLIVGASFVDFLSLGCRFGYFALEGLVYDFPAAVEELEMEKFDPEASAEEKSLLSGLSKEFDLEPWKKPEARFMSLQERYLALLELPEPEDAA